VQDWNTNIAHNIVSEISTEKLSNALPGVFNSVLFAKVVFTTIARNLQFRPNL